MSRRMGFSSCGLFGEPPHGPKPVLQALRGEGVSPLRREAILASYDFAGRSSRLTVWPAEPSWGKLIVSSVWLLLLS